MPSIMQVFERIASSAEKNIEEDDCLEQFIISLYCSAYNGNKVNNATCYLFTSTRKAVEYFPQPVLPEGICETICLSSSKLV